MSKRILNLTFHGLGDPPAWIDDAERPVWVAEDAFHDMLAFVAQRPDPIRITFDDGNASDYEIALPALRRHGLTADFFVCSGRFGMEGCLDASQVRRLREAGMRIGTHGVAHVPWRRLSPDELASELDDSVRAIEEAAGAAIRTAACPFGDYDRQVLSALKERGFERVFTSDGGLARADEWRQPRCTILAGDDISTIETLLRGGGSPSAAIRAAKALVKGLR